MERVDGAAEIFGGRGCRGSGVRRGGRDDERRYTGRGAGNHAACGCELAALAGVHTKAEV